MKHSDHFNMLLCGYVPKPLIIPIELMYIITQYIHEFGLEFNLHFISRHSSSCYQFYNILSNKVLTAFVVDLNKQGQSAEYAQFRRPVVCPMKCKTIPTDLYNRICEHLGSKIINEAFMFLTYEMNEKWNIKINAYISYISTVFSYRIPSPTIRFSSTSIPPLYNARENMLYLLDDYYQSIHLNDLSKWSLFEKNKVKYQRYRSTKCMIDHDRYISIIGGVSPLRNIPLKKCELFSPHANVSIALKECNLYHSNNSISFYHDKFHKIICGCGESSGIEWYDINKNIWNVLCSPLMNTVNMWQSSTNPNVIYFDGSNAITRMDLRHKHALEPVWWTPETLENDVFRLDSNCVLGLL